MSGLTPFQREVAQLFFALAESDGFLLAGGGALSISGLSVRPTNDLDFFGAIDRVDVSITVAAFEAALMLRGWSVDRVQIAETFARLEIYGPEVLQIDIAVDASAIHPQVQTEIGPTFDPQELAGRKMLALFGRAYPRDFVDVYRLAARFGTELLIERATEVDRGFNRRVLGERIGSLGRIPDDALPMAVGEVAQLRAFYLEWGTELTRPT
jgi:hypothetical protein